MTDYDLLAPVNFDQARTFKADSKIFEMDLPHVEKLIYFALTCLQQKSSEPLNYKELAGAASCSEFRAVKAVNNLKSRGLFPPETISPKE